MAEHAESLTTVELTPDDIESLSESLRARIRMAASTPDGPQQWILIGASSTRQREVIRGIARMVVPIEQHRCTEITERNIETLVHLYLEGEELAAVNRDVEQDNAELRSSYLRDVPTYTSADIHRIMRMPHLGNRSEPASRWKRERRVFAVPVGRTLRFPCLQFADGHPLPVIKDVLHRLPDDMTPWQTAFWFRSGNGWLDGKSPEEALDDRGRLLDAADRLREPAIG